MDWWRRATRIPLFGLAVSFWLERNTLDSSELSCHDQQQEMAQGEFHRTSFVHNGVRAHDHFIPIPRGFVDHPIVTGCVRGAVKPVDLLPWEGRKNLGGSIEKAESWVVVQQVTITLLWTGGIYQAGEKLFWHSSTTRADTFGIRGEYTRRMLKKAVQQGRSKRRGEAYASVR